MRVRTRSRQRIFRCSLQCQINTNVVFHIFEDGFQIEACHRELNSALSTGMCEAYSACDYHTSLPSFHWNFAYEGFDFASFREKLDWNSSCNTVMASSSCVLIFVIIICVATGSRKDHPSSQAKQWSAFTVSFGKKTGNKTILQPDIDIFLKKEVMPKIDGFKIVETKGVWKGQTEDSFDIVVLSDEPYTMFEILKNISYAYKTQFAQDSVLLFYQNATVNFL